VGTTDAHPTSDLARVHLVNPSDVSFRGRRHHAALSVCPGCGYGHAVGWSARGRRNVGPHRASRRVTRRRGGHRHSHRECAARVRSARWRAVVPGPSSATFTRRCSPTKPPSG